MRLFHCCCCVYTRLLLVVWETKIMYYIVTITYLFNSFLKSILSVFVHLPWECTRFAVWIFQIPNWSFVMFTTTYSACKSNLEVNMDIYENLSHLYPVFPATVSWWTNLHFVELINLNNVAWLIQNRPFKMISKMKQWRNIGQICDIKIILHHKFFGFSFR